MANGHKYYRNKTWLEHQYITLDKSITELSQKNNVSNITILNWINIFGMKKKRSTPMNKNVNFDYKNKEWLYYQYITKKRSTLEIANKCNIKSPTTIYNWLLRLKIPIRTSSESQVIRFKDEDPWNKGLKGFLEKDNHYYWKGEKAGQKAKHIWLKEHYQKPKKCQKCNQVKKIELSFDHSLGKHTRDINDYEWLCHKCHMRKDRKYKKQKR